MKVKQKQLKPSDWQEVSTDEAYKLSVAEFRGMVLQSLQDIRGDIKDIQMDAKIRGYITFAIGGVAGIVTSVLANLGMKH